VEGEMRMNDASRMVAKEWLKIAEIRKPITENGVKASMI
jgi:hypothetical protein